MKNAINWFEIPSQNLDRAVPFYERGLGVTLRRETFGGVPHAVFQVEGGDGAAVSGALVASPDLRPGAAGALIYLNAPDGVEACLRRVEAGGGTIVAPTTAIGPHGWIGIFKDLDGNLIGLHAVTEHGAR